MFNKLWRLPIKPYIMFEGNILKEGVPEDLANDPQVRQAYLGENFRFENSKHPSSNFQHPSIL